MPLCYISWLAASAEWTFKDLLFQDAHICRHGTQLGTPISSSLSIPKCFASALLQVIDRTKTLSFEIRDLNRSLAAEDVFSAPVSRLKNAMYISPKYEWLEG
jgi:hypothetical protein